MTAPWPPAGLTADGWTEADAEAAEAALAGLLPPVSPDTLPAMLAGRLVLAAGLTAAGAGAALGGPVLAIACTTAITAWLCLAAAQLVTLARKGQAAGVAEAAAVHAAMLPGRVPAATLAAAGRQLGAVAATRRRGQAWLYVAPCPGPDAPCTVYCTTAATVPMGRRLLLVLGEHPAARPAVAAAALAHEAGHHTIGWLWQAHHARTGWGWAAAGLAGALAAGWPGAAIAGAVFWAGSLAALWAGETGCDLRAARAEGLPAVEAGFGYITDLAAGRVPGTITPFPSRKAVLAVLDWAGGPTHPPLRLRRALVRALARKDRPGPAGGGR